jgi:hypothetical protein
MNLSEDVILKNRILYLFCIYLFLLNYLNFTINIKNLYK